MYRINSISKQMVSLQVIDNGVSKSVNLLPGNFVFSDKITDQMRNLEANRCIRLRELPNTQATTQKSAQTKESIVVNNEVEKNSKTAGTTVKSTTVEKSSSTSSK